MLKKIIGGVVLATSLFSITAFAASGYTGDIKHLLVHHIMH